MKYNIKKIYFGEYDDAGKKDAFVLVNIQETIDEQDVSIDYTLSFYDEENLNMSSETTMDHVREFVLPLIRQEIGNNVKIKELLLQQLNNGQ